jgi:hypothetical protein
MTPTRIYLRRRAASNELYPFSPQKYNTIESEIQCGDLFFEHRLPEWMDAFKPVCIDDDLFHLIPVSFYQIQQLARRGSVEIAIEVNPEVAVFSVVMNGEIACHDLSPFFDVRMCCT